VSDTEHALRDVDGHARDVPTASFDGSGVKAASDLEAELRGGRLDGERTLRPRIGPSNAASDPSPVLFT